MQTRVYPLLGLRDDENSVPVFKRQSSDYNLRNLLLKRETGFEAEISEEIRSRNPQLKARGTFIPWEALFTRDVTTTGGGASFIQTQRLGRVIDALRPVSQIVKSGCTVLEDLSNNISIPRWQTPSNPSALAETAAITSSTQTTSLLTLTAHRVSSMTVISRQLLNQTTNMGPGLEELIKREMLASIGSAIDLYALTGSGTGGQPLGILNWPKNTPGNRDLGKLQPAIAFGGAATWLEVNSFPASVEGTDIADDGTFGWIVSPATKYKWAAAPKITGYPDYLYQDGKVGDNPLRASNNLPSNQTIFGRWSDCLLALWPLSILVDPYSQAMNANVRLFIDVFCDVGLLRGPAFCISADSGAQ